MMRVADCVWRIAKSRAFSYTLYAAKGKPIAGKKEPWRKCYHALAAKIGRFGSDVEFSANMSYVNVLRGEKKFVIVQVSAERLDVGLSLRGGKAEGRLEASGSWNAMVTYRVRTVRPRNRIRNCWGGLSEPTRPLEVKGERRIG
jgi:hypothetical protein